VIAQNVIAFPRPSQWLTGGWTLNERALLSGLAEYLRGAGTCDYVAEDVTDRGDPWIAFCGGIDLDPLYTISKMNRTFVCHLNAMSKLLCEASTLRSLIVQVWPGALVLADIEENIEEIAVALFGSSKNGTYTGFDVVKKMMATPVPYAEVVSLDAETGSESELRKWASR
jgi:hypothetical protein